MRNRLPASTLAVLFVSALSLSARAATPGQTAYVEGTSAYLKGDYATVAEKMRVAIAEDPAEGLEKFKSPKGRNMEDYLPHFYLGVALEKLGRPQEALSALRESRRQGVSSQRSSSKGILERAVGRLEAQLAPPTPTPQPALPQPIVPPVREASPAPPPPTPRNQPSPQAPFSQEKPIPTFSLGLAKPSPTVYAQKTGGPGGKDPVLLKELKEGIRAYFAGQFTQAISRLEPVHEKNAVARLFLSYALASNYLVSQNPDQTVKERALFEYIQARAEGATPLPGNLLSPKVREILGVK